ncbi:MAG: DEAD/DEAH box helicase, partial [Owenweeksia sp.]
RYLVLDEADEMLNMGFKDALDMILSFTPEDKVTWLFSATMPAEIRRMVKSYMHDPREVKVNTGQRVNANIEHQFVITKASEKPAVLKRFLDFDADLYGVIFCRTKRDTQKLAETLVESGYPAEPLHGDLSQAQRDAVMKRFRSGVLRVLVATDVAARGIDVNNLTHVIHYALPDDAEYYTHRSGRTARAGRTGISLSLITKADKRKINYLENKLDIQFQKAHIPSMEEISANRISRWAESLVSFEPDFKLPKEAINQAYTHLSEFSREQLIEKLVGKELSQIKDEPVKIVNQDFDEDSGRGPRDRRGGDENMVRFFIGVGLMDHFNKGKLLRFICDNSGLTSNDIGRITLQRMHSYFDVEGNAVSKVDALKTLELDGRTIRVNRDDNATPRRERSGRGADKKKKKGKSFRSNPNKGKRKRF